MFNPFFMNIGALIGIIISFPIIYENYKFYKFVFCFPCVFLIIRLVYFLFFYKYDTPLRRILNGEKKIAKDII